MLDLKVKVETMVRGVGKQNDRIEERLDILMEQLRHASPRSAEPVLISHPVPARAEDLAPLLALPAEPTEATPRRAKPPPLDTPTERNSRPPSVTSASQKKTRREMLENANSVEEKVETIVLRSEDAIAVTRQIQEDIEAAKKE